MLSWLILISGIIFLLFVIFVYSGGKAKFKSDLLKKKKRKGRADRVS